MGSFRLAAGRLHHHKRFNFSESREETVWPSLRHSCRSELTRQGISLPWDRYSYGRRSPGLQFKASLALTSPFNLPAPGRRQPLYVVFDLAETCVFVKQSPYALHCGPLTWALLLPKLRSQFAEFLNELSLERLWIFSSSTCVGLGYGSLCSP